MAAAYLLDTDICVYIRRRRPASVRARFEQLDAGEAAISAISYGELFYGAHKSERRDHNLRLLEELVRTLPILPLPALAAEAYGEIRAMLESRGELIGNNDLWIAAHAMAGSLTLVTNNEREFRRVKGLKLENWAAARRAPR
ncbi:MAG: type II toxin-antitoxin system VapC family toxin [Alphaproteobacteria bacterium]|nr:type II toxin-antitoxin system VapC family toxin [Alphaproteobacteria bacterium]